MQLVGKMVEVTQCAPEDEVHPLSCACVYEPLTTSARAGIGCKLSVSSEAHRCRAMRTPIYMGKCPRHRPAAGTSDACHPKNLTESSSAPRLASHVHQAEKRHKCTPCSSDPPTLSHRQKVFPIVRQRFLERSVLLVRHRQMVGLPNRSTTLS